MQLAFFTANLPEALIREMETFEPREDAVEILRKATEDAWRENYLVRVIASREDDGRIRVDTVHQSRKYCKVVGREQEIEIVPYETLSV
eukprot:21166-Eustigmatos_ZCMA.PRE.1